ncbi:AbiU2 domain-containing protein [Albibacterium indicum]|uniref:AbiU2 domain-containing protein n=1 Tax=Albibacterium indicum TaxID=2292082 RepID=UPI000E4CDB77|nr:hypothetical protein [Pedobacter indicus]
MTLRENIWGIWETLERSRYNFECTKYLNNPETEEEFNCIKGSIYLRNIAGSLWRICIIDFHKIVSGSPNDDLCISKLINKIKNNNYRGHNISPAMVCLWQDSLEKNKKAIGLIRTLRNKLFAHTDIGFVETPDVTFSEIFPVYEMVEVIIKDVYKYAFDTHADLSRRYADDHGKRMIKMIAEYKIMQREDRFGNVFKK